MSDSAAALLLSISIFKFYPVDVQHQDAMSKAGSAAWIQSGGAQTEKRFLTTIEEEAIRTVKKTGVSDRAIAATLIVGKVVHDRKVQFRGPSVVSATTHLTLAVGSGILGVTWRF